jgi:peptidyl-prolyl cis-trans isomerase SurA
MGRALTRLLAAVLLITGLIAPAVAATVKITVNDSQITDVQIQQRGKLLKLEGKGAKAATEELINEALMLAEAKRLGIKVTEAQIDSAIQSIARNLKVSVDKLGTLLSSSGVNIDTLRDRMRATIAWNAVTSQAIQPRVQISDLALEQQAEGQLTAAMSYDYILKEVIFIGGAANARTGQANQYRKSFQGCDSAVQLSLKYTDAAVIDVGRRHATQLPEAIAKELAGINIGGITKPRVTEQGVSMLAVCQKEVAKDTTFLKNDLMAEQGNAALGKEVDAYLKKLRTTARIYYN